MGVVRALSPAGRDPALPRPLRGALRPQARHPVRQARRRNNLWTVRTDKGDVVRAPYVIAAVGSLSTANLPPFKGLSSFKGKWYHTSQWPHDGVDFTGKRVGVIGTGATAVPAIPEIAQQAKQLTVFQRTPAFCVPARNGKVDPEVTKARHANYDQVIDNIRKSFFG